MFVEITVIPFLSPEFCTGMHVDGGVINLCHPRKVGFVVAQLVEALCYKLEGCGFDFRWCRNFSLT
jgi:hypothetical protein